MTQFKGIENGPCSSHLIRKRPIYCINHRANTHKCCATMYTHQQPLDAAEGLAISLFQYATDILIVYAHSWRPGVERKKYRSSKFTERCHYTVITETCAGLSGKATMAFSDPLVFTAQAMLSRYMPWSCVCLSVCLSMCLCVCHKSEFY